MHAVDLCRQLVLQRSEKGHVKLLDDVISTKANRVLDIWKHAQVDVVVDVRRQKRLPRSGCKRNLNVWRRRARLRRHWRWRWRTRHRRCWQGRRRRRSRWRTLANRALDAVVIGRVAIPGSKHLSAGRLQGIALRRATRANQHVRAPSTKTPPRTLVRRPNGSLAAATGCQLVVSLSTRDDEHTGLLKYCVVAIVRPGRRRGCARVRRSARRVEWLRRRRRRAGRWRRRRRSWRQRRRRRGRRWRRRRQRRRWKGDR